MTIKKNHLTSISKIKKEYPLFFNKVTMDHFNSIVYKDIKVLKDCTYFITSEILEYERIEEDFNKLGLDKNYYLYKSYCEG